MGIVTNESLGLLRKYGPTGFLVVVAAVHSLRVHLQHLTPWKGGGFGMFSAIDAGNRLLTVTAQVGPRMYVLPRLRRLASSYSLCSKLPSSGNLEYLLDALAKTTWVFPEVVPDLPAVPIREWRAQLPRLRPISTAPTAAVALLDGLEVEVRAMHYDLDSRTVSTRPIVHLQISGPSAADVADRLGVSAQYLLNEPRD